MKKLMIALFLFMFGLYGFNVLADGEDMLDNELYRSDVICSQNQYNISGNFNIRAGMGEFSVAETEIAASVGLKLSSFELIKNGEVVETYDGKKYSHNFVQPGYFELLVNIQDNNGCKYSIGRKIRVFESLIYYIGQSEKVFEFNFDEKFLQNDVLFKKSIIEDKALLSEEDVHKLLISELYFLQNADKIVVNAQNFAMLFESITKVKNIYELDLTTKEIYIVTNTSENLLKRVLMQYLNYLGIKKILLISEKDLLDLIANFALDLSSDNTSYVNSLSFTFDGEKKLNFLSYVFDYLLYSGFPVSLLGLMLAMGVGVLVISVFRQVIGFSVFGIYNPLLLAVSMVVLGARFTFLLLGVAFIATTLLRLVTKKLYLLYSPKMSLLVSFYFILVLFFIGLDRLLGLNFIDSSIFGNSFVIYPIFFLVIVANKVFHENFSFFSKGWWFSFFEFLTVSFVVYLILTWVDLQYFLISYPEFMFVVIVVNMFIGRFSGLQLLEYLRFMPLIKKHFEEEE